MDLATAIRSAAPGAPGTAVDALISVKDPVGRSGALDSPLRAAHLIGQCAHESAGFARLVESLHYRSGDRIFAVFGRRHFRDIAHARKFAKDPEKLANRVYGGRMGNGPAASGDGFRFRGRGYLQLTGRSNYRSFGRRIGIDLEAEPERAAEPATAWRIAAAYLASRSKAGRTALEWADADNVEMVTRIVNGGRHGLKARRRLTAAALAALEAGLASRMPSNGVSGPKAESGRRGILRDIIRFAADRVRAFTHR